jgi:hypothetical protein
MTAVKSMMETKLPISKIRGQWFEGPCNSKMMPIFHPFLSVEKSLCFGGFTTLVDKPRYSKYMSNNKEILSKNINFLNVLTFLKIIC